MKRRVSQRTVSVFIAMVCLCTWLMTPAWTVNAEELADLTPETSVSEDILGASDDNYSVEVLEDSSVDDPVFEDDAYTFSFGAAPEADTGASSETAATPSEPSGFGASYLAFASDRHYDKKAIKEAMGGMPSGVEYVGVLGDMAGGNKNPAPKFRSSTILNEINKVGFMEKFTNKNASILCGNHDKRIIDDAKMGFGIGGKGSGVMYECKDDTGKPLYYVYGIAYLDMKYMDRAIKASGSFKKWIDTVTDRSIPIIVCCHFPLHYARLDNHGAPLWNLALNYAATGYETTEATAEVSRNVIFLYGHNHPFEAKRGKSSGEFFVPPGGEMAIGTMGNIWSRIFYTYTTAGYLRTNKTATLIAIDPENITLTKYKDSSVVDGFYDTESICSGIFSSEFVTEGVNTIKRVPPDAKVREASSKAENPLVVTTEKVSVSYSALKKKAQTIAGFEAVTVQNNKGKLTYSKLSGDKKITVDKKTGKIKVKKGLKKGTYKILYKVTASGSKYYKKGSRTVDVVIKVK